MSPGLPPPLDVVPAAVLDGFGFVWGAIWGSFLNVVIVRWPDSVVSPGSRCGSCHRPLRAFENIPILSYLLLRGRCRTCKATFSARYLLVEVLTAVLSMALLHRHIVLGDGPLPARLLEYLSLFAFVCGLVAISFIDLERRLIPDVISLPGILLGLGTSALLPTPGLRDAAIGVVGGYLLVWGPFHKGWKLLRGRPGMMLGDAKLLAMIGAFLGWQGALFALLAGSIVGSVAGIVTAMRARGRADHEGVMLTQVPFGPFLSLGAFLYLFHGPAVVAWYVGLGQGLP